MFSVDCPLSVCIQKLSKFSFDNSHDAGGANVFKRLVCSIPHPPKIFKITFVNERTMQNTRRRVPRIKFPKFRKRLSEFGKFVQS